MATGNILFQRSLQRRAAYGWGGWAIFSGRGGARGVRLAKPPCTETALAIYTRARGPAGGHRQVAALQIERKMRQFPSPLGLARPQECCPCKKRSSWSIINF